VIAAGTSKELKAQVGGRAVHLKLTDAAQREVAATILRSVLGEAHDGAEPNEIGAKVTHEELVPQVLAQLAAGGIGIAEFALAQPSLDDVFLALTGKPVK
jgi:ABC-2 type transport system ATP-binding protein